MEHNYMIKERKCIRKQKRAQHRLARDMNIKCSDEPTEYLVICNAGLVTGLSCQFLESILCRITAVKNYKIIMPLNKSYCFIKLTDTKISEIIYNEIHGKVFEDINIPLYLSYSESLPSINDNDDSDNENERSEFPPGLRLIENFITTEQESQLLNSINWIENDVVNSELKHRKVMHFGYEFNYSTNKIDLNDPIKPIPHDYKFLQELIQKHHCGEHIYDQLTINRYEPGQGIPPHIDTHSVFEDPILSLSLGSACVMDFKKDNNKIQVFLPPRSLLMISQDARYAWSHAICPRKTDIVKEKNFETLLRGTRTSFTFRKVRTTECDCKFDKYCDSKQSVQSINSNSSNDGIIDNSRASQVESSYVHDVYEEISSHFDETRHKQWPNVSKFMDTIDVGSVLLDVGCGNGKYLMSRPGILKIGCDRSTNLAKICSSKSYEVLISDCLKLPFKSNTLDAAISIAVIHHLSTPARRKDAFLELLRVLRPGGRCLIYVWAKEQKRNDKDSVYLRYNNTTNKSKKQTSNDDCSTNQYQELFAGLKLPVHENRTNFLHNDILVPWKRKEGGEFLRYYHVFEEHEFRNLCCNLPDCKVQNIYYDQGNWCTILEKM